MKRIAFILCACLLSIVASAQNVQFGVRGGLNISTESKYVYMSSNDVVYESSDMKWRPGINIGGLVNIPILQNWDVEIDLTYSMLGYKDKVYNETEQVLPKTNYTVTSHYLTLPFMAKFFPLSNGLYLELGPQFGFLMSKKDKLDGSEIQNFYDSGNKTFDFAVLGGIGYRFSNDVFVDARYIHSFTDTNDHYTGGKNRNIQISLGYLF